METLLLILLLISAAVLAALMSVADWRRRIIPDVYLFPFMLIGLIVAAYFTWPVSIGESVIAAAFGYALSFGVGWVFRKISDFRVQSAVKNNNVGEADSKSANCKLQTANYGEAIGLGDIKLLAAGGVWLGTTGLAVALVVSCILGGIWGLRSKQRFIPFAPFFFAGAICALLAIFFLI